MQSHKLLMIFLILPIILLAAWILKIETDLKTEKTVTIRMSGFDPVDLLSGHYLYLRPNWHETDCAQFSDNTCPTDLFSSSYRYYLPEFDAQKLDQHVWQKNPPIDMIFVLRGKSKPMVQKLMIDGKSWQDWLASQDFEQIENSTAAAE